MLVALIGMIVGLILYGLMIRMVPQRRYPRLRRGLAVVSTAVAFVGLTAFFGAFLPGATAAEQS